MSCRIFMIKRAEYSPSLLIVDKKFLLRNRSILPSGKLCFFDNADLSNTSGHAISSEQRNNYKSTCSRPSLWLISVATALVFRFSRHKVSHAAGQENDPDHKMRSLLRASKGKLINTEPGSPPGRDEEPTDSQVSSFICWTSLSHVT